MLTDISKWWKTNRENWKGTLIYMVAGFLIAYFAYAGLGFMFDTTTPVVAVFSGSMIPTLNRGDMVFVTGVDELKVNDIIIFNTNQKPYPIIHRVNSLHDGIKTKGDNNPAIDPWKVEPSSINGKMMFSVPYLGWVKILFTESLTMR